MQKAGVMLLLFVCMIIPAIVFSQHCDSIPWSQHRDLKWKYFKALPDHRNNAAALTEASIVYNISTAQRFAKFMVSCSFYPCRSWVKTRSTYRLLEHEQTHFDIAEYHKRLLMKEIMNRKFTSANIFADVKEIGTMIMGLRKDMDDLYDLETYHSINEAKQKEWTKKVDKMLKNLDDYKAGNYIIALN